MTKVIKSLLMFAIAASVVFQGTAFAVMVGCHTGSLEQTSDQSGASTFSSEHCIEHMSDQAAHHALSDDQESNERPCCSCDAIYKAKLDLPVVQVGLIQSNLLISVPFSSILPSTDLALPYRPPILA
ncbi:MULTISPECIES: hypothetical protein [unclassified Limnobacter]|uniref:hypothetical protein n=1 Tax=unclassified Limnobacter TaxID=2630203 RepID=UPI000C5B1EA6|nr:MULTISPECIES: hypothetical protein [unclassified Limnobacter]MAZ09557.1 hypothetical protein [Sutterellaceae bacterium]|tara:strand:+ start:23194 stop:23574 length:381 start_codon:yes stop_codon:yes gene_type:complete